VTDTLLVATGGVRGVPGAAGDAVRMRDGAVVAVGPAAALAGDGVATTTVPGYIVPGLRDAHMHPVPYAALLHGLSLKRAGDLAGLADMVAAAAARTPADSPVFGSRLDDESLAERRLPTRHDLDRAAPGRQVLLHRYCGHVSVASTAALEAAGIDSSTPDPPGGSFDRDADGRPNGVVRETAVDVVAAALARGGTMAPDRVADATRRLASLGLTSIGAIAGLGDGPWPENGDEVAALAGSARDLALRVGVFVVAATPGDLERAAATLRDAGGRVRFLGVKVFADGSLGGHTAAMRRPFADAPHTTGTLRLDDAARHMAAAAVAMGGMVACHAIGDRAVAATLDLFEGLVRGGADPALLRIEHASVVPPADLARMADLGIIASVQPAFLMSEAGWLATRVGADRLPAVYPLRSMADAGIPLAGGSDCPVEPPHPLLGIAAARDRAGVVPSEGLDAAPALALFTSGAARALGEPAPLAPGSPADLVVLDGDPLSADPGELRRLRVLETRVDGVPVAPPGDGPVWVD
jgi:predicted amidohydrolase YtcJ